MTKFEQALDDYYAHFGSHYPLGMPSGSPGGSPKKDIELIRQAIANNKPVEYKPVYQDDCVY